MRLLIGSRLRATGHTLYLGGDEPTLCEAIIIVRGRHDDGKSQSRLSDDHRVCDAGGRDSLYAYIYLVDTRYLGVLGESFISTAFAV